MGCPAGQAGPRPRLGRPALCLSTPARHAGGVISEADEALVALLRAALPTGTVVTLDHPDPQWTEPVVCVLLHAVREDVAARHAFWQDDVDQRGHVVARRPPSRRYRLCYLLAAFAGDAAGEHRLLDAALGALATEDTAHISVGHPDLPAAPAELWQALGVPPRGGLDVVVTTIVTPTPHTDLAPAPAIVDVGVARDVPEPVRPPKPPRPARRIRE